MYTYFGLETNIILLSEIGLISMCFAFYKQGKCKYLSLAQWEQFT